ncbi:MAG: hypothetical protein ACTS6A_01515 [Candidatus Hodgkinia cicadicola]
MVWTAFDQTADECCLARGTVDWPTRLLNRRVLASKWPPNVLGDARTYRIAGNGKPFEVIIGLEVHIQLNGAAKVFSGPSDEVRPLDEGLPGSLPTFNGSVANLMFAMFSAVMRLTASSLSFTRKSYRSSDIALGYQITQCFAPIASNGTLWTNKPNSLRGNGRRRIRLLRWSLEHDAANFVCRKRYVSYLRSGGSLFEVATAPDLDSVFCVRLMLVKLKLFLKTIGTRPNLRFDLNFTTAEPLASTKARTEVKNLTCLGSLERPFNVALEAQGARTVEAMTCALNLKVGELAVLRPKERSHEYKRIAESNLSCTKIWKSALSAVPLEKVEVVSFGGTSAWTVPGREDRNCEMFTAEGFRRMKIAIKVAEIKRNRRI